VTASILRFDVAVRKVQFIKELNLPKFSAFS